MVLSSAVSILLFILIYIQYSRRSPPLEVQPSFGRFFSKVNDAWISGFKSGQSKGSKGPLSDVVVVSIAGGTRDYQVWAELVLENKPFCSFLCQVHDVFIPLYRVLSSFVCFIED